MTALPRILTIMGSGETTPTMARVHRSLIERLGEKPVPAVVLDTPYGFQENADDITDRTIDYFRTTVGAAFTVASFRAADADALTRETALARIREARLVFTGPGSPSYALRQWAGSDIPRLLAAKLAGGGAVTMASAAALTLGRYTIPVYEIYKVGEAPRWLEGLDLLTSLGLPVAVVPHYDNAEGGNHDTRFCYMGERRLRILEGQLPPGTFILGVDSHTALVLDLDRRTAAVSGLGGVTVRVDGRGTVFPSGSEVSIDVLADVARGLAAGKTVDVGWEPGWGGTGHAQHPGDPAPRLATTPLRDEVAELEGAFIHALGLGEGRGAVAALLDLDSTLEARIRAGEDSPDLDNARSTFRALIARLGEAAATGGADPRSTIDPFVVSLLTVRDRAREARDWATADLIRDQLAAAGVEVRDGTDGSSWVLAGS